MATRSDPVSSLDLYWVCSVVNCLPRQLNTNTMERPSHFRVARLVTAMLTRWASYPEMTMSQLSEEVSHLNLFCWVSTHWFIFIEFYMRKRTNCDAAWLELSMECLVWRYCPLKKNREGSGHSISSMGVQLQAQSENLNLLICSCRLLESVPGLSDGPVPLPKFMLLQDDLIVCCVQACNQNWHTSPLTSQCIVPASAVISCYCESSRTDLVSPARPLTSLALLTLGTSE